MLIWGGRSSRTFLSDCWLFDLDSKTWEEVFPTGEPPAPREGFSTCMMKSGNIYFLGGKVHGPSAGFSEVYILNPSLQIFYSSLFLI